MVEKGAVSEATKRELSSKSAAGAEPVSGSLEQIFYYLSELDLDIGHKEKQKANSGYGDEHVPAHLDDDLEEDGEEAAVLESQNDPLSSYMQEINAISLLDRHQEIEIVKRIEEGENEVARIILMHLS